MTKASKLLDFLGGLASWWLILVLIGPHVFTTGVYRDGSGFVKQGD
jgi:hypothetical protein